MSSRFVNLWDKLFSTGPRSPETITLGMCYRQFLDGGSIWMVKRGVPVAFSNVKHFIIEDQKNRADKRIISEIALKDRRLFRYIPAKLPILRLVKKVKGQLAIPVKPLALLEPPRLSEKTVKEKILFPVPASFPTWDTGPKICFSKQQGLSPFWKIRVSKHLKEKELPTIQIIFTTHYNTSGIQSGEATAQRPPHLPI